MFAERKIRELLATKAKIKSFNKYIKEWTLISLVNTAIHPFYDSDWKAVYHVKLDVNGEVKEMNLQFKIVRGCSETFANILALLQRAKCEEDVLNLDMSNVIYYD